MARAAGRSEFLRAQHGGDEVGEAAERDEADDQVFHGEASGSGAGSAHLLAEVHVGDAGGEETQREKDEGEVVHSASAAGQVRWMRHLTRRVRRGEYPPRPLPPNQDSPGNR